jgi:hypothetical protein
MYNIIKSHPQTGPDEARPFEDPSDEGKGKAGAVGHEAEKEREMAQKHKIIQETAVVHSDQKVI